MNLKQTCKLIIIVCKNFCPFLWDINARNAYNLRLCINAYNIKLCILATTTYGFLEAVEYHVHKIPG